MFLKFLIRKSYRIINWYTVREYSSRPLQYLFRLRAELSPRTKVRVEIYERLSLIERRFVVKFVNYNNKTTLASLNFNEPSKRLSAEDSFIDFKFDFTSTSTTRNRQRNFVCYWLLYCTHRMNLIFRFIQAKERSSVVDPLYFTR